MPNTVKGRDPVCARDVIRLAAEVDWKAQKDEWSGNGAVQQSL
jgi:hypothetical protein